MIIKKVFVALVCLPLLTGCASIVSKNIWPFAVDSEPEGAKVVITNRSERVVFSGTTPTAARLKSGAGFFMKEIYRVELTLKGYETKTVKVDCMLNEWYLGNILIGGVIGLLIVDPATGAMYKLKNDGISEQLIKKTSTKFTSLKILEKNNLPEGLEKNLVLID